MAHPDRAALVAFSVSIGLEDYGRAEEDKRPILVRPARDLTIAFAA